MLKACQHITMVQLSLLSADDLAETNPNLTDQDYFPSDVVQNILNNVKDKGHKSHNVFCQLDRLKHFNESLEWRETARYDLSPFVFSNANKVL